MSRHAARRFLASSLLVGSVLGSACNLEEGTPNFARIDLVVESPSPDMLNPDVPDLCSVRTNPMFALLKRLSQSQADRVTELSVAAAGAGTFNAATNTCVLPILMPGSPGLYRAVVTDGDTWVTRCQDPFQFFFVVPPARHVIRFTRGEEGCEFSVEQAP